MHYMDIPSYYVVYSLLLGRTVKKTYFHSTIQEGQGISKT
jgi:hypothetical protein